MFCKHEGGKTYFDQMNYLSLVQQDSAFHIAALSKLRSPR